MNGNTCFAETIQTNVPDKWNNWKSPLSGMDKYGPQRLALAVKVRDVVLSQLGIPWIIENGTLLGAYRNGKFIIHDDDFDMALLFDSDPVPRLPEILKKIQKLLPTKYKARLVSTYCDKIEIFDSSYGIYALSGPKYRGARYHHVTVDLQCYQRLGNSDVYRALYRITPRPQGISIRGQDVFPIGYTEIEGETFQAPYNVESVLKDIYGSIAPNAKYNEETGTYEGGAFI